MSDYYEGHLDDFEEETADDCAVDFKFELKRPATCSECGESFPINKLDPTDSAPLCPRCKYDWLEDESDPI